eukprot:TRINITY_DN43995_c0_g1_i1.p1 TRINITY_DN43995_c0_g1~~TRINITY_DN43995_c0_g1_i1.p1  ORF type:complete len:477 (-),score=73.51 TRINITY_DN43995_c0_g1_i1:116-1450(-)
MVNNHDAKSAVFTLTFPNCVNVEFPDGNPASFVVGPGEQMESTSVQYTGSGRWCYYWNWKAKWIRPVYEPVADDPGAFVDTEFDACMSSIGAPDEGYEVYFTPPAEENVLWVRAPLLGDTPGGILFDNVEPDDIIQGSIGDCWLMASMSCFASYPDKIKSLFSENEVSAQGKYNISLYDIEAESWQTVTIDDRIPCTLTDRGLQPIFCRPNGEELWALLLEKAVAKFIGSYGRLALGNPLWAFQAFTGQSRVLEYRKLEDGVTFRRMIMNVPQQIAIGGAKNPRMSWFNWPEPCTCETEGLWQKIEKRLQEGNNALACMIGGTDSPKYLENDLVSRHLYSLLGVWVVSLADGSSEQLVKLRNPYAHGQKAFSGDWGPASEKWEAEPGVCEQLDGYKPAANGVFFMTYAEWVGLFTSIYVCPQDLSLDDDLPLDGTEGGEGQAIE